MLVGAGAGQSVKSVLPNAAVAWEFPISGSKGRAEYRDYAHTLGRLLNMSDVADRVKKIVIEHLGVDEGKISDNKSAKCKKSSCHLNKSILESIPTTFP